MSLRDIMAEDACAILNTDELGEQARYVAIGQTRGVTRTVRFIAQPERQTIRRAFIWTRARDITGSTGDLFSINRSGSLMTYRLLYSDTAETALQRHICHEQLSDTATICDRLKYKTLRGADGFVQEFTGTTHKAKIVLASAEHTTRSNQRRLRGDYIIYFETLPTLTTDLIIVDSSGRGYRIDQIEKPIDRMDLPFINASRIDA